MSGERVQVVDDDRLSREFLEEALAALDFEVEGAPDGEQAIARLGEESFDLVVTDLKMPGADGLDVLRAASRLEPPVPVVLVTAHGTVEVAVAAMRNGAEDFLVKPASLEQVEVVVARFREKRRLAAENRYLRNQIERDDQIVAASPAMRRVLELAHKVAASKATVLITGESGAGKEVVAARIHQASPRRQRPFVRLNCAALSESLLETELFGHERGAFTGAVARKEGRFELAHGGTLLLDEVAETTPALQAKLLRVLEKEEFERVGGTRTHRVDVRVLAATNRDLDLEVRAERFRADLFFRLNVFPIHVPPLRERPQDIPVLVEAALAHHGRREGKASIRVDADALEQLSAYRWPGNVRELFNVVQRAVLVADGERVTARLVQSLLGPQSRPAPAAAPLVGRTRAEVEKNLVLATLEECAGNRTRTAAMLGFSERTLRNKLKSWGLGSAAGRPRGICT